LSIAPDEYAGFMMTLLRLHGFTPDSVADVISSVRPVHRSASVPSQLGEMVQPPPKQLLAIAESPLEKPDNSGKDWHEIVAALQLNGLARELAQNCELRDMGETQCVLRLAPAYAHLQMKPAPDKLQQALASHFGRPVSLRFELAQNEADTPATTVGREKQERREQAITSITQDAFVRDLIESCDASLIDSTIKPIE